MAVPGGSYSDIERDMQKLAERGKQFSKEARAAKRLGGDGLPLWIASTESELAKLEAEESRWEERRERMAHEMDMIDGTLQRLASDTSSVSAANQGSVEEICEAFRMLPGVLAAVKVQVPDLSMPSWVGEVRGELELAGRRMGDLCQKAEGLLSSHQDVQKRRQKMQEQFGTIRSESVALGNHIGEIESKLAVERALVKRKDERISELAKQLESQQGEAQTAADALKGNEDGLARREEEIERQAQRLNSFEEEARRTAVALRGKEEEMRRKDEESSQQAQRLRTLEGEMKSSALVLKGKEDEVMEKGRGDFRTRRKAGVSRTRCRQCCRCSGSGERTDTGERRQDLGAGKTPE
jgi:chromosome segregation ATPase